jgi:hypothetical protein
VLVLVIVVALVVLSLIGLALTRGGPSRPGRGGFEEAPGQSGWGGPWGGGSE